MFQKKRHIAFLMAFLFLVLNALQIASASVVINEIMYDLPGSDTDREWIEIFSEETVNFSGWKFYEAGTNHLLTLKNGSFVLQNGDFAIIADDAEKFLQDNPEFIGNLFDSSFSLANTNETIAIKNSSLDIIDSVTYSSGWGGNGSNKSLQYNRTAWCEGLPTPGTANICTAKESNNTNESLINQSANETQTNESSPQEQENQSASNSTSYSCPEKNLRILKAPSSAEFGASQQLEILFNTTCYNSSKIKFLVYGSSSRIVANRSGAKITSYSECQQGTELNVEQNKLYLLNLTFFLYENCDNDYKEGNYNISLRACKPEWQKLDEQAFSMQLLENTKCLEEKTENSSIANHTEQEDKNATLNENKTGQQKTASQKTGGETNDASITGKTIYESKNKEIKDFGMKLLFVLMALAAIYLIATRKFK